ncbi:hypothetical protein WJR50_26165 [Catalinimonas sp. 4WD22]|uniref:hypothetical protein n=1 Tax=Catalinimonas locisalis TaxID=3133978 RepID=UPI003101687C
MQLKKSLLCGLAFMMSHLLYAQTDADELAKALQNPLASLISVPFQGNFDYGIGPNDGNRLTLNIQPVIPRSIGKDWNLIARVILPVISQTNVYGESGTQTGLGDALMSGFFSPKAPAGRWIWGVGPALLIPTATNELLGGKKLGIGPTAVFLTQFSGFTVGALVNHIWSIAGDEDRADISSTFLQPFIARNFSGGYALALSTEFSQNWNAEQASGTLNLVGSKVISLGMQPAQIALGPRIPYGEGNTADWGFRAAFTLMFPARR